MILKRICLLICFLFVYNCSSKNNQPDNSTISNEETADIMYMNAMELFNATEFDEAIIIFNEIEKLYPLSNEAIQAQIMAGFIDYGNLNYEDAIYKFSRIINKYPSLKNIDYVYYMKALCYYEQISDEGLDGKNNYLALENLNQLIKRFPDSKYSKDARQKVVLVNSNIAAKHMNIAYFYQKKSKYTAALNRYKTVIDKFSNTKFTPEALYRTTEIYITLGLKEEASNTASVLGFNYPKSNWYRLSYNLINNKNKPKNFFKKLTFFNNE